MIVLLSLILLGGGVYAMLLGLGVAKNPPRWHRREEALWIGRFALFFGALLFLDGIGITPHVISSWIEDILTSGGGAGTG